MSVPDSENAFSLAVVISTKDRLNSLRRTIESLAAMDRAGIPLRVIVVNNGAENGHEKVVADFQDRLPILLLQEERPGKAFALNRGLKECNDAEIVAVVDDDITVDSGWLVDVCSICHRWPEKGFFTGSLFPAWPGDLLPSWAETPYLRKLAFSAETTDKEHEIRRDRWATGGYFWFRRSFMPDGFRFEDIWVCEPKLMLDMAAAGRGGVMSPYAVAWHHIQKELFGLKILLNRAEMVGEGFAYNRLIPYRETVKQAVLFRRFPFLARVFCLLNMIRWQLTLWFICKLQTTDRRFVNKLRAIERRATYRGYLVACRRSAEYSLWKRSSNLFTRATKGSQAKGIGQA